MFVLDYVSIALILLLSAFVRAQTASTVQGDWVNPGLPDYSTTITIGETYNIRWRSRLWDWFAQYAPSADVDNVSLWFTPSDGVEFQHLIASNVNVRTSTNVTWDVYIPAEELAQREEWTFRFVPAGRAYSGESSDQISSPRVVVQNATASTTTSSTSTDTTSSTTLSSATSPSTTTPAAGTTPSSNATTTSSSAGLSTGAKVGIAIGSVAGVAILAALAWFLLRKHKRSSSSQVPAASPTVPNGPYPAELKEQYMPQRTGNYSDQFNSGRQPQYAELGGNQHNHAGAAELGGRY